MVIHSVVVVVTGDVSYNVRSRGGNGDQGRLGRGGFIIMRTVG